MRQLIPHLLPLLFLLLSLALPACGDGQDPISTSNSKANSGSGGADEGLPEAWRGLKVREFRAGAEDREVAVIDILPDESSSGLLLRAIIRVEKQVALDQKRSPEEARAAGGAWLLEIPLRALGTAGDAILSIELHDDAGSRFTIQPD